MLSVSLHPVLLLLAIGMGSTSCSGDAEAAKSAHFQRAEAYFAEAKYGEAAIEYRNAVQIDPRFGEARRGLARSQVAMGRPDQALREIIRAADLMPEDIEAQLEAARMLLSARQFEDARARADKVLEVDPNNAEAHIVRGSALAGLRDLSQAVEEMQRAIELQPDSSVGYENLAVLELARGQREEAEAALKRAAELAPDAVGPQLALVNLYWATRRVAEAEAALMAILERTPEHPLANRTLALLYAGTNRLDGAEAPLRVAAASGEPAHRLLLSEYFSRQGRRTEAAAILKELTDSENPAVSATATARLAGLEYAEGRRDQAHQMIDGIIARHPGNDQILVLKARWLLAEQRTDEALEWARRATSAAPRSVEAHFITGQIHTLRNETDEAIQAFNETLRLNPRAINAQIQLAGLHLVRGDAYTAAGFAEEAVRLQPGNAAARLVLVRSLIGVQQFGRAERELMPLLEAAPNMPAAHLHMGILHYRNERLADARRSFERTLELDPNSIEALTGLVSLDVAGGQVAVARERVESALSRRPDHAPLLVLAARTVNTAGDAGEAERLLLRAVEIDPSLFPAYQALGQLYVRQQRLDEARARFEELAARQPRATGALTMAAIILHMQNRLPEARARYERILELDPRAAVAANNLAYLYAEEGGNLDVALNLAQTAKAQLPDDPNVNGTLGWIYYKKGLANLAIPLYLQSIEKNPSSATNHYQLGLAYLEINNMQQGREALERALELGLDPRAAEDARRRLAGLSQ